MLKDYWNEQHVLRNKKALTGSSLEQYCEFFGITKEFLKGKKILEVGVGLGRATAELRELVEILNVLDISDVALYNVSHLIDLGINDSKELPYGYYDVAISYLVAQHMNDSDLIIQMENIIRSLTKDGIFYIQWADANSHADKITIELEQGGGVLRTIEEMTQLVTYAGGVLEPVKMSKVTTTVMWYGARIRRK